MNHYQTLINDCLIDTKHVEHAALLVVKNALITAASPMCQISPQQAQLYIDSFKNMSTTREKGLHYHDRHYTCVRADHNSIYCKSDGNGLIIVKTLLYVLVATYNNDMYPSVCVEAVEKLAEYLRAKGK